MPYSILSLDGGGTWALIQARVLVKRYGPDKKGHEILKEYNLVIANSGGSLVLSMLCANKTTQQIVDTFNNTNVLQAIFKKKFINHIPKLRDFLPRFDTENKYEVFVEHLKNDGISYGEKLLTQLPGLIGTPCPEIIITCFDYDRERAVYFRSNMGSHMESSYIENKVEPNSATDVFKTVTLAQAVHGASNAPVQFFDDPAAFPPTEPDAQGNPPHVNPKKRRLYWDGAVGGNNNPVKAGVLEAIANSVDRNVRRSEIHVVSIGTSNTVQPILYGESGECQPEYDWLCRVSEIDNWQKDLSRMANSVLCDPPDAASFDAHQLLDLDYKQKDVRFIRINPLIKPILKNKPDAPKDGWYMPGVAGNWTPEKMKDLFTMDMAISSQYGVDLINQLCEDYFAGGFDNQGIRLGGKKMDAILGHKKFNEALEDWKAWDNLP